LILALAHQAVKGFDEDLRDPREVGLLVDPQSFEPIPADYEQTLTDIVKAYPPPEVQPKAEKKTKK